jgi:hypothetical protein
VCAAALVREGFQSHLAPPRGTRQPQFMHASSTHGAPGVAGMFVEGLSEFYIAGPDDILELIELGAAPEQSQPPACTVAHESVEVCAVQPAICESACVQEWPCRNEAQGCCIDIYECALIALAFALHASCVAKAR